MVYKALYGDCDIWVRPAHMWHEEVSVNGKVMKRFELIEQTVAD